MTLEEIEKWLPELREIYAMSALTSRLNVIRQRLAHAQKEIGPHHLVTCVSSVEAFARSRIIHWDKPGEAVVRSAYKKWKRSDPEALLKEVARLHGRGTAKEAFDQWEQFKVAVAARNLIVHECTFLGGDKYPMLIDACMSVLSQMVAWAGIDDKNRPLS